MRLWVESLAFDHATGIAAATGEDASEYVGFNQPCVVNLGDGRTIQAYGKGTSRISADVGGHTQPISLCTVLDLPDLD